MAVGVFRVFLALAFVCLSGFFHPVGFVNGQHGGGHSGPLFVYTYEYLLSHVILPVVCLRPGC